MTYLTADAVDPFSYEFAQCPFPGLATLRDADPVHQVGQLPFFLITTYDDLLAVLKDTDNFSSSHVGFDEALATLGMAPSPEEVASFQDAQMTVPTAVATELVHRDPPVHTRQRHLINRWFTPRAIEVRWSAMIREQARSLIARFDLSQPVEYMSAFATPLPIRVIGAMLGVAEEQQAHFKAWSDAITATGGGRSTSEKWAEKAAALTGMDALFSQGIRDRLLRPRDDLLTQIAHATQAPPDGESEGDVLTMTEAVGICGMLLVAGNETTTQLLGEMILVLARNPGLFERLRHGDSTLRTNMVEETLRWGSPIVGLTRFCRRDTELHGTTIPAGSVIGVMFGGANHDRRVFEGAGDFDLDRENANRHLGFGWGIHTCLGAPLARAEARIALDELLDALPGPPALVGDLPVERAAASFSIRGLTQLPVVFAA